MTSATSSSSPRRLLHTILMLCVTGAAVLGIVALLLHVKTLSLEIQTLEREVAKLSVEADAYDRSFCSTTAAQTKEATTTHFSLENNGRVRTYQVHTPANYDPTIRYPVIVSFDGIDGSGVRMEKYSGINELPVIAVYPDSLPGKAGFTAWQGAPYSLDGDYDVAFIRKMTQALPSQYCIDSARVFAVGMSNGGGFAMIAACRLSDTFAAVASIAGAYYSSCEDASRQPSVLAIHSKGDKQVPFTGSRVKKLPQVVEWAERQAKDRDCKQATKNNAEQGAVQYDWVACEDGSIVRLLALQNRGHGWVSLPGDMQYATPTTAGYIWKFFESSVYGRS